MTIHVSISLNGKENKNTKNRQKYIKIGGGGYSNTQTPVLQYLFVIDLKKDVLAISVVNMIEIGGLFMMI